MPPRMIRTGIAIFVSTALAALAVLAAPAAQAANPTATFTKTQDWGTGYEARYTITNGSATTMTS